MKRRTIAIFPLIIMGLLLPSCDGGETSLSDIDSTSNPSDITTADSDSGTSIEAEQLPRPVLSLNENKDGLTWTAIDNASSYQVKVNEGSFEVATSYSFATSAGSYSVVVKAIGDGINFADSQESAPFVYATTLLSLSDLSREGLTVSWTATAYQTEVKFGDGEFVLTEDNTYIATESGLVTVRASGGYDEEENIYYPGQAISKSRAVVISSQSSYFLETVEDMSDTDLQENWIASKYDTSWVATSGVASVSYETVGDDNTKSMKLDVWKNGSAFRYSRNFNFDNAYNALSLLIKGDDDIDFTLRLNDLDTGVYADFKIDDASSNWVYHVMRFDDERWSVSYGGNSFALSQIAQVLGYETAGELLTIFDQFQIIVKGTYTDGGPKTYVVVDNIVFVHDDSESTSEMHYDLKGRYTGELGDVIYRLDSDGESGTVQTLNLASNISIPVSITSDNGAVNIKSSSDDGASLSYVGKVSYNGDRINYISSSGTYAASVANLNISKVKQLDDFESYDATGVGYDASHDASQRSGLRANYYSDFYSGTANNPSPLGGNNWSLMGSSDYLSLEKSQAHSGNQSGKFKRSGSAGDMRFINYASFSGINPGYGAGNSKLSFWAKGDTYDTTFRVRVYYVSKVTVSNQIDSSVSVSEDIVVTGGSDWTQYAIAISPTRVVFGFSLTLRVNWSHTTNGYPLVDDIELYSANPWASYVA